jgi:hypothetical protein
MREEHENLQACRALTASRTPTPDAGVAAIALASPADIARVAFGRGTSAEADDRRCARRRAQQDVPWLSDIRLPWGVDVHLVNISSTGLLIESGSKLTPGVTLDLRLSGPDTAMLVKARFVRSEVARIDGRGVRYHAAAEFEKALDFLARREAVKAPSSNLALAELLASVLADSDQQLEPAAVRFARGLRKLVGARDVLVRNAPIAPVDDSESIYFHVRGDRGSRSILQVMFERDRALTEGEFRLLKAAASLTAAVLELETPLQSAGSRAADMPLVNVEEPVAVVA